MSNRRALLLLFSANAISGFAQGLTLLSVPWYFAQQDASSHFNFVYAFITFGAVFWGLAAGTIVDRFPRKRVFVLTNLTEGVLVTGLAVMGFMLGGMPEAATFVVFTITIFGFYLHYPNLYALAQEISPPERYSKINSYIEIVGQSTNVLAGVLAAVLLEGVGEESMLAAIPVLGELIPEVEPWTLREIFLLDGLTYFASASLIAFISYTPFHKIEKETGSFFKRLRSGLNFLMEDRLLLIFGLFSHFIFVVFLVNLQTMMPLYIKSHLQTGGEVYGLMELMYAFGALTSGFIISRLFKSKQTVLGVISLLMMVAVALYVSVWTRSVTVFLVIGYFIGVGNAGARILRITYLFNHIPNYIIGRVNSVFSISNVLMRLIFIALFAVPFFGEGNNIVFAYAIMGCGSFLSGLVLLLNYRRLVEKKKVKV